MTRFRHFLPALTLWLAAVAPLAAAGQELTASGAFADAPRTVFPLLDRNTRLDMIDYFASGATTASRNNLGGESRVEEMSPTHIKVKMTDVSSYTLSLLPAGRDTLIAVVATVLTPAPDGGITFYDRDWRELTPPRFTAPGLDDWLLPSAKKERADLENLIPFVSADYSLNASTSTLVVTNTLEALLTAEDYDKVKAYVRPSLTYRWDGKKMKPLK